MRRHELKRGLRPPAFAAIALVSLLATGAADPALVKSRQAEKKYRKGDLDGALRLFEEARAARPGTSILDYDVGVVKYRKGDHEEAQREFSSALGAGDPSLRAASYYNLGNCLFDARDYEGAARAYRKSLELAPGDGDAKHNLELSLRMKESQPEAQQQQQDQQQQPKDGENQEPRQGDRGPQDSQRQQQGSEPRDQGQEEQRDTGPDQEQGGRQPQPDQPEPGDEPPQPQGGDERREDGADRGPSALDPHAMKPEDARRLLDALREEEERALEAQEERNAQEAGVARDW